MTYTCEDCGHTYTEDIPKTPDHEFGRWTANNDGTTHTRVCECGESETDEHNYDDGATAKEATHTETGTLRYTCEGCGSSYIEDIPKTPEHEFGDWVANNDGTTHTRVCECGESETDEHNYDDGAVTEEATHTKVGTMTYTCEDCGHTYTEEIEKTAEHEWGEWVENKTDNTTHICFCDCNESKSEPHTFDAGVVTEQASHTSKGLKTFTCAECGYSYTEDIPETTEHEWTQWSDNGNGTHTRSCRCNKTETESCVFDNGTVTKQPSYTEKGIKTYTCATCNGTRTEDIAMLERADEIVSSDNSEIKVTSPAGSNAVLDKNTVLKVEDASDKISEDVKASVAVTVGDDNAKVLASYDISLILDGAKVQPGGEIEVTLPAPENADEYDSLTVVYIDDNGGVTPCDTRVNEDGTLTFITNHFSHYAVIGVNDADASFPIGAIIAITVGAAAVIGAAIFFFIRKRRA